MSDTSWISDFTVSGRYDISSYFYAKVEGHFMQGNLSGFFPKSNPGGLKPDTKLLVAKIGFSF